MKEREQLFSEYLQELKKTAASAARGRQRGEKTTDHNSSTHSKLDKVWIKLSVCVCGV